MPPCSRFTKPGSHRAFLFLLLFHQLSVLLATHYAAGLDWRRLLLLLVLLTHAPSAFSDHLPFSPVAPIRRHTGVIAALMP
jgi:glucose-6-phosphate-specific signal transduction histidine kinase